MSSPPSAETHRSETGSNVDQEELEEKLQISRHNEYYMDDELSVFLVENSLFRVHRYYLVRESEVFKTMFACPNPDEGKEGVDDTRPIHLPGVTRRDFETLLDYFYKGPESTRLKKPAPPATNSPAPPVANSPRGPIYDFKRLLTLLKIATFYDMVRVRRYAINTIQSNFTLAVFDKLDFANTYDIPQWAESAYQVICSRSMPLTLEEARRVGIETAVLVSEARERLLTGRNQLLNYRNTLRDQDVVATVRDVFFPVVEEQAQGEPTVP